MRDLDDRSPDDWDDPFPQPERPWTPGPVADGEPIHLILPYPPSANNYKMPRIVKASRGRPAFIHWYLSKAAQQYKTDVEAIAMREGITEPITGRVQIDMLLFPHRPLDWEKRQRKDPENWDLTVERIDLDNARKIVYDALKGIAFGDDKLVYRDTGEVMLPDEWGKRVEVIITPCSFAAYNAQVEQPSLFDRFEE